MDKDFPRIDRSDGILWLTIAILLLFVYLMANWVFEQNATRQASAGHSQATTIAENLD